MSRKALLPKPEGYVATPPRENNDRGGRGRDNCERNNRRNNKKSKKDKKKIKPLFTIVTK